MDWNRTSGRNREALGRIVAVLVALAVLAERAAARSAPGRWLVLSILRSAEAVAREFVAETTRAHPAFGATPRIGSAPEDALILASRLWALAAALGAHLSKARRSPCRSACTDSALFRLTPSPGRLSLAVGAWTPNPNDTS